MWRPECAKVRNFPVEKRDGKSGNGVLRNGDVGFLGNFEGRVLGWQKVGIGKVVMVGFEMLRISMDEEKGYIEISGESKVHVYLAGDSSGGNIVHHVAVRAAEEEIEVLGNILLHPLFGGEKRTESELRLDGKYFVKLQDRDWYWRAFLPEGEDRDHPACNPFGPRGKSLVGLKFPKSLVCVAGLDVLQDWQLAYVKGLEDSGQQVQLLYLKEATIGFYFLPNNDHFYSLMKKINNFVNSNSNC